MEQQMNKAKLLQEVRTQYAALESLLAPVDEVQMTTAGVNGEWSIKDILAHIIAWHHRLLVRLHAARQNDEPAFLTLGMTDEDIDRLNEQFYQENLSRPLTEVLTELRTTHLQIVETMQAMADNDLLDPNRFAWTGGRPLWHYVAGDTFGHYVEHMGPIEEWLVKAKAD